MTKDNFTKLYNAFLEKVVNNILVSDKVKNALYVLYYYLDESDLRMIFNKFYILIYSGLLPQKIEPSPEEWEKVVFSLYLDKAAKRGYRLKVITPAEREEIASMAKEMSDILSTPNDNN